MTASCHLLVWELQGITYHAALLIGQYSHHKIFLPSSFYGIHP